MEIKAGNKINKRITIIDYGMGNIQSVSSAIKFLGYESTISNSHDLILRSTHIILPGVGEFRTAMSNLEILGLSDLLIDIYTSKRIKILGICLGMQLLARSSEEGGFTKGLGLIPGEIVSLEKLGALRLPHIGFNEVSMPSNSVLGGWSNTSQDFYFVHSYCLSTSITNNAKIGITEYGQNFISLYEMDPIYATQFHPEKSQTNGLYLIKSFLEL
tara:strand:- start:342 stop:986 length:645 start_codon:yes stop_codon:yes gene_type:complete